jgi:hypothetical protein
MSFVFEVREEDVDNEFCFGSHVIWSDGTATRLCAKTVVVRRYHNVEDFACWSRDVHVA